MLETVLDMLRDPDNKGQHEVMGWDGLFDVDQLEFGSALNYLSAAANQKSRNDHSSKEGSARGSYALGRGRQAGQIIAL